jgi:hypothetical protein
MRSYGIILAATAFAACAPDRSNPVAPQLAAATTTTLISASSSGPATPPFNDEIILRDVTGGEGFGHVKFRQPKDEDRIVYLDTWIRDLQPNTTYQLQRATDANVNDDCTGTNWLTLGRGAVPQSITTDWRGTGREDLFRNLGTTAIGSTFDIHFRVIDQTTHAVVLESDCYQFVVIQ